MPKLGIVHFDERGQIHQTELQVTAEELAVYCWLPARFLGGMCDRYYSCRYTQKANCKAGSPKILSDSSYHKSGASHSHAA
jgi:hypothetical protein